MTISQADRMMRDGVARDLFVQRLLKAPDDPNKQPNAMWIAQDALRDADTFILARDDHDKAMAAKPAVGVPKDVRDAAARAGIPMKGDGDADDLAG